MSITNRRAADLLCSAFEGGSNYWYMIEETIQTDCPATPWGDEYTPTYISAPFSTGGSVIISDIEDEDGDTFTLDKEAIRRGKWLLGTNPEYSAFYADVLSENEDGETGDVFLQLCLFGEIVYG